VIEAQTRSSATPFKTMLALFVFAFVFLVLDTTVWSWVDRNHFRPDLTLVLVVYLGLSLPMVAGGVLAVVCGLLTDTVSGGPIGLFIIVYLVIFGLARLARQKLDPASATYQILVVLALAATAEFLTWVLLFLLGWSLGRLLESGLLVVSQTVSIMITALVSPAFFWLFARVHQAGETKSEEEG
jgi:rod shape-determining protein MreD